MSLSGERSVEPAIRCRKEEISRKLLCDGAGAAHAIRIAPALHNGTNEANGIDAPVREEALIFRRNQGIDEILRQFVELDDSSLFAILVIKVGYQFGRKPGFIRLAGSDLDDPPSVVF